MEPNIYEKKAYEISNYLHSDLMKDPCWTASTIDVFPEVDKDNKAMAPLEIAIITNFQDRSDKIEFINLLPTIEERISKKYQMPIKLTQQSSMFKYGITKPIQTGTITDKVEPRYLYSKAV